MAQNLLTIDREKFRSDITKLSFGTLKNLLEELFVFIKSNVPYLTKDQLIDLERKQTIIWAELQRRGKLTKDDYTEFYAWLYKKHAKRIF
jgi:DNA phosphorothioation-dependent restriction protein DptG